MRGSSSTIRILISFSTHRQYGTTLGIHTQEDQLAPWVDEFDHVIKSVESLIESDMNNFTGILSPHLSQNIAQGRRVAPDDGFACFILVVRIIVAAMVITTAVVAAIVVATAVVAAIVVATAGTIAARSAFCKCPTAARDQPKASQQFQAKSSAREHVFQFL
ncbi:MAG: hypothetical protein WCB71_09390 [Aestuariivirga sp.]